ncbi:MAG: hypothetical protein HYX48_03850 [Chlamydiales bacterium]|nr:hypothetical protein [Chlamydiales bacterium]
MNQENNRKRSVVLSCLGLGDGLISLILSNNLHLNGDHVTTYHPFLSGMQSWFPGLPIRPFPALEELSIELEQCARIFIFYEKSPWMQAIIAHCELNHPKKTTILNPIATPNTDYRYWENGKFDGNLPFADNLYLFCRDQLKLEKTSKSNGIHPPAEAAHGRYPNRVLLHPTSSRPGKNWPEEKFIKLNERLKKLGYRPVFILTEQEKKSSSLFSDPTLEAPLFHSLDECAHYIYESGYMIGNDSGIGHLASCLNIPTLTICRNALTAKFWRPAWTKGEVLFPPLWIPNLKGLRLRDKHWKKWITVDQVIARFLRARPRA